MVGQDAVFAGDVDEVGTDAQREQIQVVVDRRHGQTDGVDQRCQQLERHASPRQFFEGITAVFPLGVEQGVGDRQRLRGQVVVAHDGVDARFSRGGEGVKVLGAAVEGDDQGAPRHFGAFDAFGRHPVALAVPHGDVRQHGDLKAFEEGRHHGDRGRAVHVVIAVDHDALVAFDGLHDPGHGFVHVLHQEGVVHLVAAGVQKVLHFIRGSHAALDQQGCNQRAEACVL